GSSSITSPNTTTTTTTTNRSKSTTTTRPPNNNNYNYYKNSTNSHVQKKQPAQDQSSTSFTKFFGGATKAPNNKPVPGSSSAWALSPARSLPFAVAAAPPKSCSGSVKVKASNKSSSSSSGGVLKYFIRHKKVSRVQEEDFHRFRILHNGLLQWRFVNAKALAAMAATEHIAEVSRITFFISPQIWLKLGSKLFSVWLWIFKMRNSIMEKKIEVQRVKHEIKLYQILNPQILHLNEWAKLEKRNQESVGKLATKLSAISIQLPLINGAKADVMSIYEAMYTAIDAMDGIESIITKYFFEVERILYMVTELLITTKQQIENLEELEKTVTLATTLLIPIRN
ncbi:hypothetical protein G4B88_020466, partial [Cannabis sativa]